MEREPNILYAFFASELRRARLAAGLSLDALGKRIGYSAEQVSKVENGDRRPVRKFAQGCDNAFPDLNGLFERIVDQADASRSAYPSWFEKWVDAETRASALRSWEPLLVPGLLQTADYARALFESWLAVDGNRDTEADVAARLRRQEILSRPSPPSFVALLHEPVLYQDVGGAKVMREQLLHLAEISERPRVTIQVLPPGAGSSVGLLGAFALASFDDETPGMVYLESPDEGETTRHPGTVARVQVMFDVLREEALGARASRDLIRRAAEEKWTA